LQLNPNTKYTAHWYNPRTGTYTPLADPVAPDAHGTWVIPPKADDADWVLRVQADDKAAAPPPPHLTAAPRKPLEGSWSFEDSLKDASGNEHHGALQKGAYAPAKIKKGLDLNGKNAWARIPSGLGLEDMGQLTVSVWVLPRAWPVQYMAPVNKDFSFQLIVNAKG